MRIDLSSLLMAAEHETPGDPQVVDRGSLILEQLRVAQLGKNRVGFLTQHLNAPPAPRYRLQ